MAFKGSDHALPPIDMDPTPQMKEIPSPDANDISTRFVHLQNLVEMTAMHMDLVEPKDLAITPEDPSVASEPVTPIGDVDEIVNDEYEATPSLPSGKTRKLAESSGSEPDRGKDSDMFFLPLRSSPKPFLVDDSIAMYVSSCFYTYLKDDDFNKVKDSDLKPDLDFFQAPIVNSTIKDKISDPGVLRGNSFIFKFQFQLISGANGIFNLWQHIKDSKDLSHADVLRNVTEKLSFKRFIFRWSLKF